MVRKSFFISKIKNTILWAYVITDLNGKDIVETLYEKKLEKKKNQEEFKIKNVVNKKGNKLYVKWKVIHGNSSNSWIYKKSIV